MIKKKETAKKEDACANKGSKGLLSFVDSFFVKYFVPLVPKGIETYHLTLLTILWSLIIILGGYLSQFNIHWLWLVSGMIFMQYFTDVLDGAVGRARNTGLIKWGYYMDHFLDYIFLASIIVAYAFLYPAEFHIYIMLELMLFGAFMINSYLEFSATGCFKIHYLGIGPTEVRLGFILVNIMIIFFARTYLLFLLPYVLGLAVLGLVVVIFRTQRKLWKMDEDVKGKKI